MKITLSSAVETEKLAAFLAMHVRPGDCLALSGGLGMGKTTFARAFLRALAGNDGLEVPSPSFALVQPYDTPVGPVFHYDLWRLDGPESLVELAWDDACEAIMLVEWPERAGPFLPSNALHVCFESGEGAEGRKVMLRGWPKERLGEIRL